ncbi:hypothetical protein M0811_03530 [Anaeramoeba ignava]|uniref:TLC domain-containing protein n=1 Tax=Anaeramoeba ignava TaxID=1746090 RepID=A0A9Q0L4U2_ANAIG|nr:hypothetical protein M0811_03530 [Anaeramoeba ignava]
MEFSNWNQIKIIGIFLCSIFSLTIYYFANKVSVQLLVFAHSILSSFSSIISLIFGFDPSYSISFTSVYFIFHTFYIHQEPCKLTEKITTYFHHLLGLGFGFPELILQKNGYVCLCFQANEVSNIFLSWYRWKKTNISGIFFAIAFFSTRVLWDTFYILPFLLPTASLYLKVLSVPLFTIQYIWLYKIIRKFTNFILKQKSKKEEKKIN